MNTTGKPSPTETIAVDTRAERAAAERRCQLAVAGGFIMLLKGLFGVARAIAAEPDPEEQPAFVDHMGNPCNEYDTLAVDTETGLLASFTRPNHPNNW